MKDIYVFMFPGIMYFWVFFIGQGPMQEILTERDDHTLQRIMGSPATLPVFLLSKMVRCFLLCGMIQALLLLVSAGLFGIGWGRPLHLFAVVVVCAFSVTGVLSLLYAVAKTRDQAFALSHTVVVVSGLVGGSFFPIEDMPAMLQSFGRFAPNHWAIVALQSVAFAQPPETLIRPLVVLSAVGLVGSVAALLLLSRRLIRGGGR
jgi:ABC-2 type transport system permease protein